jgi:hypothetical protein
MLDESDFAYMSQVISERSLLVDQDAALRGSALLSIETQDCCSDVDLGDFITSNLRTVLPLMAWLLPQDKEMLLAHYVLGKPQFQIAAVQRRTQTWVGSAIREAVQRLAALVVLGPPTDTLIEELISQAGLQEMPTLLGYRMSELFCRYREIGQWDFEELADENRVDPARLRADMRAMAKKLRESPNLRESAMGIYLWSLVGNMIPKRENSWRIAEERRSVWYRKDPDCLGEFRVDVTEPGFDAFFTPRSRDAAASGAEGETICSW